ncbi:tudor domain-containing 6 isoform X2 [Takifugu flavidus]|uniref:tudor domain-containing 6 isoform X2 n=1 Tax=Takifugu flavidus TaxID=433684 RepID=UPI002544A4E3|nr:tudor domain-containing 6 isoform X2 [Takifugu flavidus]
MSSLQGFPVRGADITLIIAKVHLHPLCALVEFWGKFCQESRAEYESLAKDIQTAGKKFQEFEGKHGDQCLVQIDGTWYRCRIVSRSDNKYSVFLIDRGMTYSTITANLAWGKSKYFQLPPEVEYCVLANTLPLSNDNRWSPIALEFLKYLPGKSVYAHVQDVFVAHRTFLLDIPSISKQMCDLGMARKLSPELFRDFVVTSLQPQSNAQAFSEAEHVSTGASESLHRQDVFLYPEISAGSIETVVVTHVINPHRFFCQLKVFSKELQKLSDHLSLYCEGRMSRCSVSPELIGFPCATRRSDGRWCRSVLQQVFPSGKVVEVLNVDCGNKECVQVENVSPLAAEFFRMPVVTYICSLYGIADRCGGWTSSQIDFLKSLLLNKTVIARFEYQNICEGVYFVTLHGEDNVNLNNLFGSRKSCLLEDFASPRTPYDHSQLEQVRKEGEREINTIVEMLPCEDLPLNSSQPAIVQHASNPSEFWIQTFNYANELEELMERIKSLYKDPLKRNLVSNPAVGLYCAAKAEDGDFYRAKVVEVVDEKHIQVFFVDYGSTEVVYRSHILALPREFKMLPCLALKCTLAGVKPKAGEWSHRASEYFRHAVLNAAVNVHVADKHNGDLAVWLTLDKAKGEKDVGALMCMAGFAEKAELTRRPQDGTNALCAGLPPSQLDRSSPHVDSSHQTLLPSQHTPPPPTSKEGAIAFKMSVFPVGSVLDVTVSYIESPSNFWCQLLHNTGTLNLLMHNIQDYYRNSHFQPVVDAACVARRPENGLWYRALVVHRYKTPHVKVLLVDYGQTEEIPLFDLRSISPEFLTLPSQALRCSLLNPIDPISVTMEWNKEAIASFEGFVETTASSFVILKCTIFAVMHNEEGVVFHIVDLATPFESTSSTMANMFRSAAAKKYPPTSVCLDTYFYSTHNIRVGTEEQMTVTCVNSVGEFFCQPNRNADVIINLKIKLNKLCQQLENTKCPTGLGMLCFAKYTDRQWYRGQIKATTPAVLVHFVDYGDTIEVKRSDLLPVPKKVNDIMSVPAQAVLCRLSDVPVDVPRKVNRWFQSNVTERSFRALIVARESDGTLLVELYHEKTQINAELKKLFRIEALTDERAVQQSRGAAPTTPRTKGRPQIAKATRNVQDTKVTLDLDQKPTRPFCENSQKVKPAPLELYRPPHQRSPSNTRNCSRLAGSDARPKDRLVTETRLLKSKISDPKKKVVEKLPTLKDLPSKCIQPGLEAEVYVSYCHSPSSFYVQLVRDEDELTSMVAKLNDPESAPQAVISQVQPGDLVRAEFAEDSSWYRAVVRETSSSTTAVVEFVDFGNAARTPLSKMRTLEKHFLQLPIFTIHCLLHGAAEEPLDPDATCVFVEKMSSNAEKVFKCKFIRQRGSMWEVSLNGGCLDDLCKSPSAPSEILEDSAPAADISRGSENLQKPLPGSPRYSQQDLGQTSEVCVSGNDNGVTTEEEKIQCFVEMETSRRVINEALETTWKSSTSERAAVGPSPEYETPLQPGSTLMEPPRAEDQMEHPASPQTDGREAQNHAELHLPPTERKPSSPGGHLPLEPPEGGGDSKNEMTEKPLRETLHVEVVSRTTSVAGAEERLSGDVEDQKAPPRCPNDDQSIELMSFDQTSPESHEEEAAPAPGPTEQDDLNTPVEQNPTEDVDHLEADLICLHGDDNNCICSETSVDNESFSGVKAENTNNPLPVAKIKPVQSTTTAKMVPREALGLLAVQTSETYLQEFCPLDKESVSPSSVFPPPGDPSWQQAKGEEVSGASIDVLVQNDWMTEGETHPCRDTHLALHVEATASAVNTSPDLHPDQGDEITGPLRPVEEAGLADACSDEGGGSSCEAAAESVCGATEETVPVESVFPQDQSVALPSETEQQAQRSSGPEVELVEEATSLVEEIHLGDVSADPQPEATVESESEILQQTPLKQA